MATKQQTPRAVRATRGTLPRLERSRFALVWLLVLFVPIAIAILSLLLLPRFELSGPTYQSVNAGSGSSAPDRTASIVLRHSDTSCEHKMFDNQTGKIVDANTPCPGDVMLDAKGMPVPIGTTRTMDAISKSFGGR